MKKTGNILTSFFLVGLIVSIVIGIWEAIFWILKDSYRIANPTILLLVYGVTAYVLGTLLLLLIFMFWSRKRVIHKDELQILAASIPIGLFATFFLMSLIKGGFWHHLFLSSASIIIGFLVGKYLKSILSKFSRLISVRNLLIILTGSLSLFVILLSIRYNIGAIRWIGIFIGLVIIGLSIFPAFWKKAARANSILVLANLFSVFFIVLVLFQLRFKDAPVEGQEKLANILLITIDTLRPDRLGCYGNKAARTPQIDHLAEQGTIFHQAIAPYPHTGPSHVSILTGLYPHHHGVVKNGVKLSEVVTTLPEILAAKGYQTAAFVSGYTLNDESCGLASEFDLFDDNFNPLKWFPEMATRNRVLNIGVKFFPDIRKNFERPERRANEVNERAMDWLKRNGKEPFFLWVHYFDPHAPYDPPAPYDKMFVHDSDQEDYKDWYHINPDQREELVQNDQMRENMVALYDGEIAYTDSHIEQLLSSIKEMGFFENTMIILTADHGESLGEHNSYFDHGDLYDVCLKVPLIFHHPKENWNHKVPNQTRLIDISPTILDYLNIETDLSYDGQSLLPFLTNDLDSVNEIDNERIAYGMLFYSGNRNKLAVRYKNHKLLWNSSYWQEFVRIPETKELYNIKLDPDEITNIHHEGLPLSEELTQLMMKLSSSVPADEPNKMTKETIERLRSLGYIK